MGFHKTRRLIGVLFFMIINFFLLKYTSLLFIEINNFIILGIVILLGFLQFLPIISESKKSTKLGRFLANIMGIWMGAVIFLAMDVVAIYILNYLFKLPSYAICIILAIVPILAVYNYYKAHKLVVNEQIIELDNLKEDMNIIHLSDVHFGSLRHKGVIKQITTKLKDLEKSCELVIISGDLADGSSVIEKDDFLELKNVNIPIIFTPGNHDFYPGIENVYEACRNAGIIILNDARMEVNGLNIFGKSFSFGSAGPLNEDNVIDANRLVSSIKQDMVNIIIYHIPSYWEEFSKLGFDIQLSGHTHGGQFYPAVWFCKLMFGFNKGLFKSDFGGIKDKYLNVTTGVGVMDYPMRWGTDSELVVLKLRKK